jgi:UDP-N-acetylglucosamine--N-acetylmuramyl-(pentapeptide) pyrophosphoryl-undecaprenol N-acetylglucosamine transferase
VLVAFPDALPHAEWTGNPIREELARALPPKARYAQRSGPLNVLVFGGSLGAAALNEVVPRALALLDPQERPHVVHQAGAKHIDALKANYVEAGLLAANGEAGEAGQEANVRLVPFIDDMKSAYANADLVICRSGAMTVAEIAAVGVAALFVPFPHAVDDHQTTNAAFLADHGAALVVQQRDLTVDGLAAWLRSQTRESLAEMAERSRSLAKPDATEQVAQICASVAGVVPSQSPSTEGRQQ